MKWRERVITEVAKRLHARWAEGFGNSVSTDWEACDRKHFMKLAEESIRDVIDGAKNAGWRVDFVGENSAYHERDKE